MHRPVLLKEVVECLDPGPSDLVVDGTAGGGGHAAALLDRLSSRGRLVALDWDAEMVRKLQLRFAAEPRVLAIRSNYADLGKVLAENRLPRADCLLLDLGFSSEQLAAGRGFSFRPEFGSEALLMTYDESRTPVRELLRRLSEKELADLIFRLSGERFARRIARAIKERIRRKGIRTSGELAETVRRAVPPSYERGRIDPATRTFQALRIRANEELGNLERILADLEEVVVPGGRAAIITFHSLEDRLVKHRFQELARGGRAKLLTPKPVAPGRMEQLQNPRSRSAKLRAIKLRKKSLK